MTRKGKPRYWVGWREWIALPDLAIDAIKVKVDTGASTSAIHAVHIKRFSSGGRHRVRFGVHPLQRQTELTVECVADVHDERYVTSSTGQREKRLVIRTSILIANRSWPIELTLANRDTMGFRMLLGRAAMHGRLLVDPSVSYLAGASDTEAPRRSIPSGVRAKPE